MKISFVFNSKKAECFPFSYDSNHLMIYFTSIFRMGIGYKYRTISPKDELLSCADNNTGISETVLGRVITTKSFRTKYWGAYRPWVTYTTRCNVSNKQIEEYRKSRDA